MKTFTLASAVRRFRVEADWCLRVVLSAALGCAPLSLRAGDPGPQGNVVAGDATFNHQDSYTGIRASDGAIIEYDKFNIPEGYTVEFIQPHELARVLNRVTGADPSSLLGNLRANGIVYFVNPAGIYFGKNAVIDVGQIYAAAGSLSNSDFLSRNDNFTRLAGSVVNDGAIRADAIHLVGQTVRNAGVLSAPAGLVMLAAGDDVLIGRRGEHVFVNATATSRAQAPGGAHGVENTGRVESAHALLAAGDLYAMAVKNSGVIKSRDVQLAGQGSGEVWNTGTIDAANTTGAGGRVEITGRHVGLGENSLVDASGATGGGEILVGGDYQGANAALRNAEAAYVAEGATLRADATADGVGGKVVVWADDTTRFFGNISATGITRGGLAEVSGKKSLLYAGLADLRAASGQVGTLLLDPDHITISDSLPTSGVAGSGTFTAGEGDNILAAADLWTQLDLADVTVKTSSAGDIVVDTIFESGSPFSLTLDAAGSIRVLDGKMVELGADLTLRASGSIALGLGARLMAADIILDAGTDISVAADSGIDAAGGISLTSQTGTISLAAGALVAAGGAVAVNGGLDVAAGATIDAASVTVGAGGRAVAISGTIDSFSGVSVTGASTITVPGRVAATSGSLTFIGNVAVSVGGAINANSGGAVTLQAIGGTVALASTAEVSGRDIYITGGLDVAAGASLTTAFDSGDMVIDAQGRDVGIATGLVFTTGSLALANVRNLTLADVTTNGGQTYAAANNITLTGTLATLDAGAGVSLTAGTGTVALASTAAIDASGAVAVNGGFHVAAGGTVTNGAGAGMTVEAGTRDITIAGLLDLVGSSTFNGAGISVSGTVDTHSTGGLTFVGRTAMSVGGAIMAGSGGAVVLDLDSQTGDIALASTARLAGAQVRLSGGVTVAAGAALLGAYGGGAELLIDGRGRDVRVAGDLDLSSLEISDARYIALAAVTTDGDQFYSFAPDGAMRLDGPLVSRWGNIDIFSPADFPAAHATIFSTSSNGILISATAGDVTIGRFDTLLAYDNGSSAPAAGTIRIEAGGTASLGSLSASRSIDVSAGEIHLEGDLYQAPSIALAASGSGVFVESGSALIATGSGGLAPFAIASGSFTAKTIAAGSMSGGRMTSGGNFFPVLATGSGAPFGAVYKNTPFWGDSVPPPAQEETQNVIATETNPANQTEPESRRAQETLVIATEGAMGRIDAQTAITDATREQLKQLGIFARGLSPDEIASIMGGQGLLTQLIPSETRQPENYQVADGRISEQAARAALAAYESIFIHRDPATGEAVSRVPEIRAALAAAFAEFRAVAPSAPPAGFARFVQEQSPASDSVLSTRRFAQDMSALFDRIESLGLTSGEVLVARTVILRTLRIPGMPSNLLGDMIAAASADTAPAAPFRLAVHY
ncbi:filamentous hemagglutinin N-terminal domain-containing protein [Termitidicoccus mucosus]